MTSEAVIEGKWVLVSQDNMFDFLEKHVGYKLPADCKMVIEWKKNADGSWTRKIEMSGYAGPAYASVVFKPGDEFDSKTLNGRPIKVTVRIEGNVLTENKTVLDDGAIYKTVRTFNGNKMESRLTRLGVEGRGVAMFERA